MSEKYYLITRRPSDPSDMCCVMYSDDMEEGEVTAADLYTGDHMPPNFSWVDMAWLDRYWDDDNEAIRLEDGMVWNTVC